MQIQIESTATITTIDGVPCRTWKGVTSDGTECFVYVHRIAVANAVDHSQFERELLAQPQPLQITPPPNPDDWKARAADIPTPRLTTQEKWAAKATFTLDEVAALLQLNPNVVRSNFESGRLRGFTLLQGERNCARHHIEQFLREQGMPSIETFIEQLTSSGGADQ